MSSQSDTYAATPAVARGKAEQKRQDVITSADVAANKSSTIIVCQLHT